MGGALRAGSIYMSNGPPLSNRDCMQHVGY